MEKKELILKLLQHCTKKTNKPRVSFSMFFDYIHKYTLHNNEKTSEMNDVTHISKEELHTELEALQASGQINLITDAKNNTIIINPLFFVRKIREIYKRMDKDPEIPFPLTDMLPPNAIRQFTKVLNITSDLEKFLAAVPNDSMIYRLVLPEGISGMLFPANFTFEVLLEFALAKIRVFLKNDDSRDYLQKRLIITNPGKDLTIRNFIKKFKSHSRIVIDSIKDADDAYIYRGQLCTFIRQEFSNKHEKMINETALLQAVTIIEYFNNYYRNKIQKKLQRTNALKNLHSAFKQKPYYFSIKEIWGFVDARGIPLLGQFSEEDLNKFIEENTKLGENGAIPEIIGFINESGAQCYVASEKVVPLLISFLNKARKPIYDSCIKIWRETMLHFDTIPAMNSDEEFNKFITHQCQQISPNLSVLLNHPLLLIIINDLRQRNIHQAEINRLFPKEILRPIAEIIPLHRTQILNDAKILLPLWYTIPFISWIMTLFRKAKTHNQPKQKNEIKKKIVKNTVVTDSVLATLRKDFLPPHVSLEEALEKRLDAWNQNLDVTMREHITEDVNHYIQDYVKHIRKQLKKNGFTSERIRTISKTLSESHSLQKVKNRKALRQYIELYTLKILDCK